MKSFYIFFSLVTVFAVATIASGCSRPQGTAAEEGQRKLDTSATNVIDLKTNHKIDLQAPIPATQEKMKTWSWQGYSEPELKTIEAKLQKQMTVVDRIFDIHNRKSLRLHGANQLKLTRDNAKIYFDSLQSHKQNLGTR